MRALRPILPLPKYAYGQIAVMLSPQFFKYGSESSMERKFLDFSLQGSECSICGLFVPGNESAEERKVQIPL